MLSIPTLKEQKMRSHKLGVERNRSTYCVLWDVLVLFCAYNCVSWFANALRPYRSYIFGPY